LSREALRRLLGLLSLGPAVVVSVAYTDPGNFGTNIAAGSTYGLRLLWVVWASGAMAILFQYLSGKTGLAGVTLTDYVFSRLSRLPGSKVWRLLYFLSLFVMVLATDMAEFLGIAVGVHLLFHVPLELAVWLSVFDVLILMFLADRSASLEMVIGSLVAVVALSYLYEMRIVGVSIGEVIASSFRVSLGGRGEVLLASSIIGATIMPHAVLLHSYLARDKWGVSRDPVRVREALRKHAVETVFYLLIASMINVSLQVVSYYAFYLHGIHGIESLEEAYKTLTPLFGSTAALVFGVAILASGLSSSMVSVIAGVSVLESYRGRRFQEWKVRLTARLINMIPLYLALRAGLSTIGILVYSQAVLSATLPLVLIPLIHATMNRQVMGVLANRRVTSIVSIVFVSMIITINILLL